MASWALFPTQWLQPQRERNPPWSPVVADPLLPRPASLPPPSAPSSSLPTYLAESGGGGREALPCSCLESHVGPEAAHLSPQAPPALRSRDHTHPPRIFRPLSSAGVLTVSGALIRPGREEAQGAPALYPAAQLGGSPSNSSPALFLSHPLSSDWLLGEAPSQPLGGFCGNEAAGGEGVQADRLPGMALPDLGVRQARGLSESCLFRRGKEGARRQ